MKGNSAKTIKLPSRLVYVKIWRKITLFVVLCHVLDRFLSRILYKQWNYKWPLVCPLFVGHVSPGISAWKIFYDCLLFCYRWDNRKKEYLENCRLWDTPFWSTVVYNDLVIFKMFWVRMHPANAVKLHFINCYWHGNS